LRCFESEKSDVNTYVVGDLQGCLTPLLRLLEQCKFQPESGDRVWFAGDLVNRGQESLATLRFIRQLGDSASCVLGNHDLHLLAAAAGHGRKHRSDTLDEILTAHDSEDLINWLRRQPLAHRDARYPSVMMVHAGVLPQWTADQTMVLAQEVHTVLRSDDWQNFMAVLYGNQPIAWQDHLSGTDRLRLIVNALTRLRFCSASGEMDFKSKDNAGTAPTGFMPWFDVPNRASINTRILFGHWSTLGLTVRQDVVGLDTGCVWGGCLTALRLEDNALFSARCEQAVTPWEQVQCG
jgi:bis(5'-nucleosyl)-tetraphosphatase (symmetrical)